MKLRSSTNSPNGSTFRSYPSDAGSISEYRGRVSRPAALSRQERCLSETQDPWRLLGCKKKAESQHRHGHMSKSGKRRFVSAWACGQRLSGGTLQRFSSRALQPKVGSPFISCGWISRSAEHIEHSISATRALICIDRITFSREARNRPPLAGLRSRP